MAQTELPTPVEVISAMLAEERKAPEVKSPEERKAPPQKEAPREAPKEEPKEEAQPEAEAPAEVNQQIEGKEGEDAPLEIPEEQLDALELEVKEWAKDGTRKPSKRTIKELREGYMRLDDYSRNIQDVARQRDEVPQKVREGIEAERKVYQEGLKQLHDLVMGAAASELKAVNWDDLAANDPAKYVQLRNRADQLNTALTSIKNKQAEIAETEKRERSEADKKAAREARAQLERDIPNFNDDLYRDVMKAGAEFGYPVEEVAQWIDPRAIKLLHAVHEFKKLKPGNPEAKKVVIAPKVVKPGPAQAQTPSQKRDVEAMKRLQSSGRVEDAAAVIRSRL